MPRLLPLACAVLLAWALPARAQAGRRAPASGRAPRAGVPAADGPTWAAWWERNRTELVGFRHVFHRAGALTGKKDAGRPDPLGGYRPAVLRTLRVLANGRGDRDFRRAAVLAIGRMGAPGDALLLLDVLGRGHDPDEVREAAALALGMLPGNDDAALRAETRRRLVALLARPERLPDRARQLALLGAGLRARRDGVLAMSLAEWTVRGVRRRDEAAALAFAAGLAGDRIFLPELLRGARAGEYAGRSLPDVARSHVVLALGRLGDPLAADALVEALRSAPIHSQRSAALALGRLLRLRRLAGKPARAAGDALLRTLKRNRCPLLRGYCALALGGARHRAGLRALRRALADERRAGVRPWAALGLALAARGRDTDEARVIRGELRARLRKARHHDLHAALCVAAGLAGGDASAAEPLLRRVERSSLPVSVRGAAAQGLGMLRRIPAGHVERLVTAMHRAPDDLVGDVALALGMLGRRSIMPALLERLRGADSRIDQRRLMLALGHLGHRDAAVPLLRMVESRRLEPSVRALAATALGLMGDDRESDVLFGLEADFNYLATTTATRALLDAY